MGRTDNRIYVSLGWTDNSTYHDVVSVWLALLTTVFL